MQAHEHPPRASFAELAVTLSEFAFHEADTGDKAEAFVAKLEVPSPAMERAAASIKRRASLFAEARRQMVQLAEHEAAVRRLMAVLDACRRARVIVMQTSRLFL